MFCFARSFSSFTNQYFLLSFPSYTWSTMVINLWQVDHLFRLRINSSVLHASDYLKQFPSPIISIIAKFISFVSGGFAAVLLIIAFLEESLLEGHVTNLLLLNKIRILGNTTNFPMLQIFSKSWEEQEEMLTWNEFCEPTLAEIQYGSFHLITFIGYKKISLKNIYEFSVLFSFIPLIVLDRIYLHHI